MPDIVDDQVYFLVRQKNGKFEIESQYLLADLNNTVPGFGDRMALTIHDTGFSMMEVVGRYFVRHLDEASDTEWIAWHVIVQPIDLQEADDLFEAISENYSKYVKPAPAQKRWRDRQPKSDAPAEQPHDEFKEWRRQDEERDKHRPIHKLNAPQMRALRFMIDHPDLMTSDLIPRAAEKTMEALAKAGCLRPGGKNYRGYREWHVTDEGRAEVQRHDTYKNWGQDS